MATREELIGRTQIDLNECPDSYETARVRDEVLHDRQMKRDFLNHFYEMPEGERWNIEAYDRQIWPWIEEQAWPWNTETILTAISDLQKLGKIGSPLSSEQVAQRKAAAKEAADEAERKEREGLIERLLDARHPNDPRITRYSNMAWQQTQDTYQKQLATLSTEQLRARVAELEGAARLRGLSYEDLRRAARNGETAASVALTSSPKRRSPEHALDPSYTADRLRHMSQSEMNQLCRFSDGRPRLVGGVGDSGAAITVMDMVLDRLSNLS